MRRARSAHGRNHRGSFVTSRSGEPLSQLRPVGHHRSRPARRARRPQAGAAAHPVHDVPRPALDLRRPAGQVRQDRRRRDRQLPPARRRRRLRRPGPPGPALGDARAAGPRPGQLRLRRWRHAGRQALHRGQADRRRRAADGRAAAGHRDDAAQLRQRRARSRSSCRPSSRTCSSTASPASPSAWRRTSRRTTSATCSRRRPT